MNTELNRQITASTDSADDSLNAALAQGVEIVANDLNDVQCSVYRLQLSRTETMDDLAAVMVSQDTFARGDQPSDFGEQQVEIPEICGENNSNIINSISTAPHFSESYYGTADNDRPSLPCSVFNFKLTLTSRNNHAELAPYTRRRGLRFPRQLQRGNQSRINIGGYRDGVGCPRSKANTYHFFKRKLDGAGIRYEAGGGRGRALGEEDCAGIRDAGFESRGLALVPAMSRASQEECSYQKRVRFIEPLPSIMSQSQSKTPLHPETQEEVMGDARGRASREKKDSEDDGAETQEVEDIEEEEDGLEDWHSDDEDVSGEESGVQESDRHSAHQHTHSHPYRFHAESPRNEPLFQTL